jgi:Cu-Zn family superoxide dismutase
MLSTKDHGNLITAVAASSCLILGFVVGYSIRGTGETDILVERGICVFGEDQPISGYVRFGRRVTGKTFIQGNITGMEGIHGIHIHEYGNMGDNCRAAGSHFNPFLSSHGGPASDERHIGDLGNIVFTNQTASILMEDPDDILNGEISVIGRSIVIHQGIDDLGLGNHASSSINGRSGPRMACCIIAIERN